MTPEQLQQVEDLFADLCEMEPAQRDARLNAVVDGEVRAEVGSLLRHSGGATLNGAIGEVMQAAVSAGAFENRTVGPGTRFDHYRIEGRLGQGGMGDVYEAVREDDFHKRVALKIVRYGLDSEFAHRQFQKERQVLAGLEHPYIARLLDGGTAGECPYLVLEYIEGTPVDEYCRGRSRETILRLFLKVCEAVSYAHRSLIIHRDLKPPNIMVTEGGDPKLLDFGIARLVEPGADVTQTGFAALTPQYASPEQLRGGAITVATDVYSLGLVLYELLTGRKPYTLAARTAVEIDRMICQTDPARPGISDDLDNIVMMAIRKDPARRYQSVHDFGDDIQRSLTHRPVSARADTVGYRGRKFVRRHWAGVAAAVALLITVVAGVAATVYQARLAGQRFEQVRKLAHNFVFDYDAELARVDGNTAVRERMVGTALEYLSVLSRNAGGDIGLQRELAAAWQKVGDVQGYPTRQSLGHTDQAIASYRKAAAIHEAITKREPSHHRETGSFYLDFAHLLRLTGDYGGARSMAEAARRNLEQMESGGASDDALRLSIADAWCTLGDIEEDTSRSRAAFDKFTRCESIARGVLSRSQTHEARMMAQYALERVGTAAASVGRLRESLDAFAEDERLLRELIAKEPANPSLRRNYALLGQWRSGVYYDDAEPNLNDPARCLEYSRAYLQAVREMVARDPNNASAQFSLAIALFRLSVPLKFSDPAEAVASARESVRLFDAQIAAGNGSYLVVSRRARALRRLSEALLLTGQSKAAAAAASEALIEQRREAARDRADHRSAALLAMTLITSARAVEALGERDRALGLLMEAESVAAPIYAEDRAELTSMIPLSQVRLALSGYSKRSGDAGQAQRWAAEARRLWREFPEQNDFVRRTAAALAE